MALQQVIKCFLLFLVIEKVSSQLPPHGKSYKFEGEIPGKLLVSPYIKAGRIEEARELSLVTGLEPNITSYSGFLTVNEECNSNLFYWYFPSQNDVENDPFSVWLNGGPGSSSLIGLLTENGPYSLTMDGKLELREYSWNRNSSIIYFDSPVGTGFSYTDDRQECYASEETQVGRELLAALQQFFVLFPELQDNHFYITGESYAGKYIPALAYAIHKNENASNINFKGFAIGNGWVDAINQNDYSPYLYQLGLIDDGLRELMAESEAEIRKEIEEGNYITANLMKNALLINYFGMESDYESFYNYLYNKGEPMPDYGGFVSTPEVREALHVGNATFQDGFFVYTMLSSDIMQSVRPWLEELIEHYRIVIYNGQLDIIVAYPLTLGYLQKMEWSGAEQYRTADRSNWYVGEELAGYSKTVQNFTEILVRNAGHMVPTDQPAWALDLYHRLIFNQPF